jgi:hypothetical protein
MNENRPRPAIAAGQTTSPQAKLATTQGTGSDGNRSFTSSLGASKTFPMTREVYTTNMNIGLPTVKQKNMSEGLLRMLERPRTAGKLKQEAQHESMASVTFSTRPGTAASVRRSSSHDPRLSSSTNLVSPLFSAYGISPKHAIPSFAPTQFLQRPISAQRAILRPPSASSMSSFASSSQRLQPASSSPSKNRSGVYCDAKAQDHVGVGAAKLVELTQKLVMKRMQSSLEGVDNAQWKSSDATFLVDLPIPSTSSSAGSTPIAPQPWMRLHADTEEIIVQLEWDGSAPAVHDSTRAALIQTLGEPASVAKLHALCGGPRSVPDLDLSVIMLDDKLAVMDVVYYNNLCSRDCSLLHSGDNTLSGIRRESAVVTLSKVSPGVHAIAFSVNLHGTVPPSSQQQRAVSTEGRPSSSLAPKSEQPASNSAALDAISASDVLWVPENCRLRVLSSVHSFALASYNISFVASDDVWNPKLTRRPMSGGGRLRTLSKSSSLDNMVDCDADVQTVEDNDGDAAWDELDDKNQSSVSGQNARRAGRFLGSSLRRSIHETRMSSMEAPRSEEDAGVHKVDSSRDLVQQVALAANQAEATTVQYIDWISFVDTCDASGNLHIQREVCLTAFRDASAALSDSGSSKEEKEEDASISTRPLPLSLFASMLQTTLLPLVRQSEYKLPSPSTLRRGMEAMCACLGCDSRQPLNEQVIDIARVQRGANVFCLHRGNQSSAFASSIAAENRTAGKHSFSVERSWFLQTLGSVTLAVNLVQNLSSMRELLVMSGVFIPVIVAVEYCTADRPSLSLRGRSTDFSDRYDALKARVERSLPFVKVEANPTWLLPGGPRISAFEVFFQDPSNMNCICVHSKSESKCWPNAAEVVAKLQRLMQAREKVYKLPVDLCPVRLMCKSSFKQMPPLDGVPVHIHRIGDENEISDIISMAGAPASQLHSLDSLQGEGVSQFVTQDAATLCFSGRSASDGMFSTRLTAGVFLATVGGDSMVPGHVLLFVRTLHKETITATVIVKPQLFRLSGRVVDGSSGNPITHGSISLRNCGTDGEVIVVQLASPNHSDACIKTPVPQLAFSPALQPDTFSDSSGSRASEQLLSSGHQESSHASSGESIPPQGQSMSATVGTAALSSTGDGVLSPRAPHVADCADDSVSSTIFAVVNGSADDLNRNDGRSSPSITRSEKIKQSAGLFEIMVPQGDYTLTVNIHGYSAGGVYKVSIRRGALHMGVICVNPDTDLLLLNNLRDLRAKKCFSMQGILSANMPLVSAVLDQANAAEAATKAAAVENAAFKKRVLRSKVSRCSESNPASFVSSYQLSVPLVLLRSAGVVADKAGKISIRHRSHRFASLVLPPSSCKPGFDAPAADKLPVCKNKAAHIARHILCGASRDFCEKFCTIDSRALSDDKDLHRESFTLVIQAGDSTFENGGTFLKVASGQRFAAIAGLPVAFTLHMNDRCMNPCLSSLDAQDVSCTARLGSTNLAVQVFETCDLGLGRYVISFLPPMEHPGAYSVSCTVKNIHVEGSPFTVTVVPYEPAVTFGSRLTLQPVHSCLPWPHCCPPDEAAPETPTVIVTKDSPALVARGWYAPFELYNEETARWVGSGTTVGEVDVVFVIEICLENQRLVEAIRQVSDYLCTSLFANFMISNSSKAARYNIQLTAQAGIVPTHSWPAYCSSICAHHSTLVSSCTHSRLRHPMLSTPFKCTARAPALMQRLCCSRRSPASHLSAVRSRLKATATLFPVPPLTWPSLLNLLPRSLGVLSRRALP